MSKSSEPQLLEITVNAHGGGKLALQEYGKESVEWGSSFSRKYSIPEGWDAIDIDTFERTVSLSLRQKVDDANQPEYEAALKARH